jgi:pathogenesis-related protein 1
MGNVALREVVVFGFLACLAGCGISVGGSTGAGASVGTGGTTGSAATTGGAGATGSGGTTGGAGATGSAGMAGGTAGSAAGGHTNPLGQAQIDAFVSAHNQARSGPLNPTPSPALPPVSWDYVLADSAYNYTSKCMAGTGGLVAHNANRTADYQALGGQDSYVGENIYASTGNSVQPSDAVNSWMSEASAYDYARNNITDAGHYTQVVWRNSVRIGCAIYDCPSTLKYHNTILCDYAPGGNITTEKPY